MPSYRNPAAGVGKDGAPGASSSGGGGGGDSGGGAEGEAGAALGDAAAGAAGSSGSPTSLVARAASDGLSHKGGAAPSGDYAAGPSQAVLRCGKAEAAATKTAAATNLPALWESALPSSATVISASTAHHACNPPPAPPPPLSQAQPLRHGR